MNARVYWLTPKEVANQIGVTQRRVYLAIRRGELKPIEQNVVSGSRLSIEAVEEWLMGPTSPLTSAPKTPNPK